LSDALPILSVRNVSKAFGAVQALAGVSCDVGPGEVVALAGDNGAGKSTIIKAISGVFRHDTGDILLEGEPIAFATPQEAREHGIETIYQDLALADNLSIGENIFLGREPKRKLLGVLPVLDRAKMAAAAKETMARLDFLVTRLDAPVAAFSGGQRQAIAIGRALYWNARLVIMDEPTAALGVPEQRRVLALVKSLRAQGKGIIFISSEFSEMVAVCHRVIVMQEGRVVGELDGDEITELAIVELCYGHRDLTAA
jgi:simple sugar transport system ATP-binding protein